MTFAIEGTCKLSALANSLQVSVPFLEQVFAGELEVSRMSPGNPKSPKTIPPGQAQAILEGFRAKGNFEGALLRLRDYNARKAIETKRKK